MVCPVIYDALSEASHTMVSATSRGSPNRFRGASAAQLSKTSFSLLPEAPERDFANSFSRPACIGDTNIHAPEFGSHIADKTTHGVRVANVDRLGIDIYSVLRADPIRCCLKRLAITRAHRHAATLRREGFRRRFANALARCRYDRHPVL